MKTIIQLSKAIFCGLCLMLTTTQLQAQVLDLESTTEGALLPRMNTAERTAISSPSQSELVYDTETQSFWYWDNMQWNELKSGLDLPESFSTGGTAHPDLAIPDNDPTGINSVITLTETGLVDADTEFRVCLNIEHTFVGDLEITLIAPDGTTSIDLSSDNGSTGENMLNTCFSDDAINSITSIVAADAPFSNTYMPEVPFSTFMGQNINGDWTLQVVDGAGSDIGTLESWSIDIGTLNPLVATELSDSDQDTRILVEKELDDDMIRFDVEGEEVLSISKNANGIVNFHLNENEGNTFVGHNSGNSLEVGVTFKNNTGLGFRAGEGLTSGFGNTFLGSSAGQSTSSGYANTYIGYETGRDGNGSENVAIGNVAGRFMTGNKNIAIGNFTGQSSTGDGNIMIGEFVGGSESLSDKLLIGNSSTNTLIEGSFTDDWVSIAGSGFFREDTGGLPSSLGKGVRVYYNDAETRGRIFAYDYENFAALDLSIQATGGDVLIGNDKALGFKLSVDGKVACEEVLVQANGAWPDYVFEADYALKSLEEVQAHIQTEGHLPGVPSAKEVEENGILVGDMNKILMEKVEELTLYMIDLKASNDTLRAEVDSLNAKKNRLWKR